VQKNSYQYSYKKGPGRDQKKSGAKGIAKRGGGKEKHKGSTPAFHIDRLEKRNVGGETARVQKDGGRSNPDEASKGYNIC